MTGLHVYLYYICVCWLYKILIYNSKKVLYKCYVNSQKIKSNVCEEYIKSYLI